MHWLSLAAANGGYSLGVVPGPLIAVAMLQSSGSSCHWAMWDLLGPETEPVSPALPGRFITTGSPGSSLKFLIIGIFL